MGEVKTKADQKHYPVECCPCNCEFNAAKSILQSWGINDASHALCPCGEFLNLIYIPQGMIILRKKEIIVRSE